MFTKEYYKIYKGEKKKFKSCNPSNNANSCHDVNSQLIRKVPDAGKD